MTFTTNLEFCTSNDVLKHTHNISREHRTVCGKTVLLGEGFFSK